MFVYILPPGRLSVWISALKEISGEASSKGPQFFSKKSAKTDNSDSYVSKQKFSRPTQASVGNKFD